MILVDSSIWIDHFRQADDELSALLQEWQVACHPFVIGELACGHLSRRQAVFEAMEALPMLRSVPHGEVLAFVERHRLMARGIGWIDVHLLASALVSPGGRLWSRDKRLAAVAAELQVAHPASH